MNRTVACAAGRANRGQDEQDLQDGFVSMPHPPLQSCPSGSSCRKILVPLNNPAKPSIQPYLTFGGRCDEAIEFYRTALGDGGKVTMPIGRTFWSPRFGMVMDRFGVGWMVNTVPAP